MSWPAWWGTDGAWRAHYQDMSINPMSTNPTAASSTGGSGHSATPPWVMKGKGKGDTCQMQLPMQTVCASLVWGVHEPIPRMNG